MSFFVFFLQILLLFHFFFIIYSPDEYLFQILCFSLTMVCFKYRFINIACAQVALLISHYRFVSLSFSLVILSLRFTVWDFLLYVYLTLTTQARNVVVRRLDLCGYMFCNHFCQISHSSLRFRASHVNFCASQYIPYV